MSIKQGFTLRAIMAEKNISVSELARRLNVSRAAINNYSSTETFQDDVLEKIIVALQVSKEYFVGFKERNPVPPKIPSEPYSSIVINKAFAKLPDKLADVIALLPSTFSHIPMFSQGELAIQVTSHSMRPYISHGDFIVVKKIINMEAIIFNEVYMIDTKYDYLKAIHFIREHNDRRKLILASYDCDNFQQQSILKENILEMYRVVGLFRTI